MMKMLETYFKELDEIESEKAEILQSIVRELNATFETLEQYVGFVDEYENQCFHFGFDVTNDNKITFGFDT